MTLVLLSLVYAAITFQQSGVFGVCLDIGRRHAGSIVGLMNTSAQVGGLLGSIAYGYLVSRFQSYDAPFVPMAVALGVGTLLWFKVDAAQEVQPALPTSSAAPLAAGYRSSAGTTRLSSSDRSNPSQS
jgi:MFS transporter, ACS family, glucarate transporter